MKCKICGKEKIWMEYTEMWACPDDCDGSYGMHSFFRLGISLSPNPNFDHTKIRWKTKEELQALEESK